VLSAPALLEHLLDLNSTVVVDALAPNEATELCLVFATIERAAGGMKTKLARRAEETDAWRTAGHKSAADALAAATGTTVNDAKQLLETSHNLASLPATAEAMCMGALSLKKAEVIAAAAKADPSGEAKLLATADQSLREVRDECMRVRAAKEGDALYERVRRQRRASTYTDAETAWNLHARGPADQGAAIARTLDDITDEIFKQKYAMGAREPREAYAFDALVEMARRARTGEGTKKSAAKPLCIMRLDWEAFLRGWTEGEEVCEIAGVGPVPVSIARQLLGDAVLKLVITKGVDVLNVTHLGRAATVAQRTALLWTSPMCTRLGCNHTHRLEIDHRIPWAETKHTRLEELDPLCGHDHWLKTHCGWELVEGAGRREMVPPDDPRHPRNRPPPDP